ncbi:MAG: hypothetical protein JW810_04990 [Sedimentisphaerales bacterium]|nr:hypothetical protein [Sedimentisphaerales bacterium]
MFDLALDVFIMSGMVFHCRRDVKFALRGGAVISGIELKQDMAPPQGAR